MWARCRPGVGAHAVRRYTVGSSPRLRNTPLSAEAVGATLVVARGARLLRESARVWVRFRRSTQRRRHVGATGRLPLPFATRLGTRGVITNHTGHPRLKRGAKRKTPAGTARFD
ncbi:MAG: hypothetical protein KatS3mg077_1778 [Candidatus Binatia bacterium]|nr:MAG: hypothetical protein KatS3mg077_1778 [Candidatus Binatia bacterium]